MLQRWKDYAAAWLVLAALCAIYQLTFVNWLEPDPLPPLRFARPPALRQNESLANLFPEGSWQRGNCKRLQTRDGALLFENWSQVDDDQWKLWPLTVVLGMNSDSPLLVEAEEGAEIQFSESLDVMSGGAPPIERGQMIGNVRIRSVGKGFPVTTAGGDASTRPTEQLEILSSDFGIDYRKIWTTQPIVVKLGDLRLEGRDLTLHLAPMGNIRPGGEAAMSILNRLELIYLDRLIVPLPSGGLWKYGAEPTATNAPKPNDESRRPGTPWAVGAVKTRIGGAVPAVVANNRAAPINPAVLRSGMLESNVGPADNGHFAAGGDAPAGLAAALLRCAGRVEYHFGNHELTLRDNVRLEHHVDGVVDLFSCEYLKLQFADPFQPRFRRVANRDGRDTGREPDNAEIREELGNYLLGLVAQGQPAMIQLPSFDAEVSAEQIELDVKAGSLRMTGRAGARISYAGNTWRFKQVSYHIDPVNPNRIGTFDALGSGLVEFAGDATLPIRRLRWTDNLKLEPPDATGEFILRVDGNVTGLMNDGGEFACDSAMLVLRTDEQFAPPGDGELGSNDWLRATRPTRFQATGHVHFRSSMVDIATRLLRLYFEFTPTDGVLGEIAKVQPGDGSDGATEHAIRRWVRQPSADRVAGAPGASGTDRQPGAGQTATASTPVAGPRPAIHGDTINAKLRLRGKELTATDLTVVGNVSLKHTLDTPNGPLPAILTGENLQLRDTAGDEILQIGSGLGSPAKLKLGDGHFIGPLIQVRLADNLVWIRDAGEFQVPTQMLPRVISEAPIPQPLSATGKTNPPPALRWVSPPRCRWRGQMLFDGSRIVLTDGVDLHGAVLVGNDPELWDVDLVADNLQVTLQKNLPMREFELLREAAIESVGVQGTAQRPLVITANQLTETGFRKARHVLNVPQLVLHPQASQLVGDGPGWYRAWMQSDQTPLAGIVTSEGQRPADRSLIGAHLVFRDSLRADLTNQNLKFLGDVRIASRPVQDWEDRIDVQQIEGLRMSESTLDCDSLMLGIDPNRAAKSLNNAWELEASGQVLFQTRNEQGLFHGQARRATYTAAKDIFLIEGEPGYGASVKQTLPTGAPGMNLAVKRMSVNTQTLEVINVEFERLQLGTLPGVSR